NQNSVLLNLDKARHFVWVKNDKPFAQKKDLLIGRGAIYQQHRFDFYEKYFKHPLCDLGAVGNVGMTKPEWLKPKISIKEHLDYKFILSLQGNDVATNLKWIMSSNSIAVMPKPTVETWFMEGKLIGGVHYIEIKPDYSDLEEQLNFYIANPDKCLEIIENAHKHCEQFWNKNVEDLCSLLVLEKYFLK
ncbi:MAG: glycosyl transferase family 90, partial [Capnocytophaga sp.]|nr:glycosyl transferase family 90 [Capnocytophaga sp.]